MARAVLLLCVAAALLGCNETRRSEAELKAAIAAAGKSDIGGLGADASAVTDVSSDADGSPSADTAMGADGASGPDQSGPDQTDPDQSGADQGGATDSADSEASPPDGLADESASDGSVSPDEGGCPATNCDDGDPCTQDSCVAEVGCQYAPAVDGTACDDGDSCTLNDACTGGTCSGTAKDCDDGKPCTDDACVDGQGCTTVNNSAPCDDGLACTVGDACAGGTCKAGPLLDADGDGAVAASCGGKDCDDSKVAVKPGAPEVCGNGLDDNCSGQTDEGCPALNANGCPATGGGSPCGNGKGLCSNGLCQHTDAQGYKWTLVPAGVFWMGCNPVVDAACSGYSEESPQHQVELSAYWIGVYEVTAELYKKCLTAGGSGCTVPSTTGGSNYSTYGVAGKEQHPLNFATWSQAQSFCQWLGGDLPTEAQWEKAARGGCELYAGKDCKAAEVKYPWGNNEPTCGSHAVYGAPAFGCGTKSTYAVGTGSAAGASPYGVFDMAGNVWEWNLDWYDDKFYTTPGAQAKDPINSIATTDRVARGGSLTDTAAFIRASFRNWFQPSMNNAYFVGVRCAKPLVACAPGAKQCVGGAVQTCKADGTGWTTTPCDDANACTDDSCSLTNGCVHVANTMACSDGNDCTVNDACAAGACKAGPLLDADGDGAVAVSCGGKDCDDSKVAVKPGAPEVCGNGLDDNCSGQTDEGCQALNANGCPASGSGASCGSGKGTCSAGQCQYADAQGYKWTLVPAGVFWMGCNPVVDSACSAFAQEGPQHDTNLSAYWIGVYEVTADLYKKCVTLGGTGCTAPSKVGGSNFSTYDVGGKGQHPVNFLDWGQAQAVCAWLGGDLPTEAQWEKAARGGCETYDAKDCKASTTTYPWGNVVPVCAEQAVFGTSTGKTCGQGITSFAVGVGSAKGASPYGAFDMAGNVAEWTMDWYDSAFYSKAAASVKDPWNSTPASYRTARGGGFDVDVASLRSSYRGAYPMSYSFYNLGVRCSRSYP